MFFLHAACLCHSGLVRLNNEDNFLFNRTMLDEQHHNMESPLVHTALSYKASFFAVFDGMGGEAKGEVASYAAAQCADFAETRCEFVVFTAQSLSHFSLEAKNDSSLCTREPWALPRQCHLVNILQRK